MHLLPLVYSEGAGHQQVWQEKSEEVGRMQALGGGITRHGLQMPLPRQSWSCWHCLMRGRSFGQ